MPPAPTIDPETGIASVPAEPDPDEIVDPGPPSEEPPATPGAPGGPIV